MQDKPEKWEDDGCPTSPVSLFAEAVYMTRMECHGVPILDIAKCFRKQFDEAELENLIVELTKGKI